MFFTTALKDYIDQLNDLAFSLNDNFTTFALLKCSFLYVLNSIKVFGIYVLSFTWITDFVELPCNFKATYSALFTGSDVFSTMIETKMGVNLYSFTSRAPINANHLGTGLLNSFFLALPLSLPHLLTIRCFLLNGIPAAIYAASGTILGQLLFLTCVLFGFSGILIPFQSLEPLNYIIGLGVIVNLLYKMTHDPIGNVLNKNQKKILIPLFTVNFFLAWTEQTSIFQYFGNLTVNSLPTLLQNNYDNSTLTSFFNSILPNISYLSGILLGTIGWTILFGMIIMSLRNWVASTFLIPFTYLNEKLHYATLFVTFTFCLTSIPYYGFDYLVSNPLGFVSQDKSLVWAKTAPVFKLESPLSFNTSSVMKLPPIFFNTSPFDRQSQLKDQLYKYEDFSYEPNHYWNNRYYIRNSTVIKTNKGQVPIIKLNKDNTEPLNKAQDRQAFLSDFYDKSEIENKSLSSLETKVDTIASTVLNSNAYNYFDVNLEAKPVQYNLFRQKYYGNPLYKALTQFEMNAFLLGQPKYQNITASDEAELYNRRIIFNNYLDSIEQYKSVTTEQKKPFASKVYNQQFKGTFDHVRQYFLINLTQTANNSNEKSVLKFDQPLYNANPRESSILFHEELKLDNDTDIKDFSGGTVDSAPFYIGWDGLKRKFLVKTNWTPGIPNGLVSKGLAADQLPSRGEFNQFSFQAWPKTKTSQDLNSNISLPYTVLSKQGKIDIASHLNIIDPLSSGKKNLSTTNVLNTLNLPSYNWSNVTQDNAFYSKLNTIIDLGNTIPPQFGGITWPGQGEQFMKLFKN
uniref:Putative chloroplast RF1 n=1 Tax=Capsosiphon fulvescens TaxID=205396 RepID=A0A3P8MUM6_9CHLO|nr:putative chloroplast RF1 [Capsosiphon fulvescens]AWX64091.1 putative chloroplast RF1 [Capsosiphon fulvescens]